MATPLVLVSLEVVTPGAPVMATSVTIEDTPIISPSVPTPTLVNGRPA